jgi:formylglycine-generating enzyme required for sulfatase activity
MKNILFVLCYFWASSLWGQPSDFELLPSIPHSIIKTPKKPTTDTPKNNNVFLKLSISTDMLVTVYSNEVVKDGLSIKPGEKITLSVTKDQVNLRFVGPDGFSHVEKLNFKPEQRDSHQTKHVECLEFYNNYQVKKKLKSEEDLQKDGIKNNMVRIGSEGGDLEPFEICKYEITVGQYAVFKGNEKDATNSNIDSSLIIRKGDRKFLKGINWQHNPKGEIRPKHEYDHPVVNVNLYEALEFCEWLTKEDPVYKYRLPTAEEWEWVAGCGDGWIYPWGMTLEIVSADSLPANIGDVSLKWAFPKNKDLRYSSQFDDGFPLTSPVGSFPSPCNGIADMGGNVAEWTTTDLIEESSKSTILKKVVKGGSYFQMPTEVKPHKPKGFAPELRHSAVGFRVVREPK